MIGQNSVNYCGIILIAENVGRFILPEYIRPLATSDVLSKQKAKAGGRICLR